MRFVHQLYGIEIDTASQKTREIFSKLKELYKKIPQTKCLNCPGKIDVQAECCKVFSPPMLLVEFIRILSFIEEWDEKKKQQLLYDCFRSYLSPSFEKRCNLLNGIMCDMYPARPLSCRLYGLYPADEWGNRLKNISRELGIPKEEVPMCDQCKNISVPHKGLPFIPTSVSDSIFKSIHSLDIDLFPNRKEGAEIVMSASTYMPFDTHFLCFQSGPENVEKLTVMKNNLRKMIIKVELGKETKEQLDKEQNKVDQFLEAIKQVVFSGE